MARRTVYLIICSSLPQAWPFESTRATSDTTEGGGATGKGESTGVCFVINNNFFFEEIFIQN